MLCPVVSWVVCHGCAVWNHDSKVSPVCLHCWHYDVYKWWHNLLTYWFVLWDVIKQQLQQMLPFHKSSTCKAAKFPDSCGSFPNLRPILCMYEFLMKLPTSVNIWHFSGNEWHQSWPNSTDRRVDTQVLSFCAFLANVNSTFERELMFPFAICRRPSICLSSVMFVRPTQGIEIFGNVSTPFGTLAICDLSITILRRSSQGNPSVGGDKPKRGSQI